MSVYNTTPITSHVWQDHKGYPRNENDPLQSRFCRSIIRIEDEFGNRFIWCDGLPNEHPAREPKEQIALSDFIDEKDLEMIDPQPKMTDTEMVHNFNAQAVNDLCLLRSCKAHITGGMHLKHKLTDSNIKFVTLPSTTSLFSIPSLMRNKINIETGRKAVATICIICNKNLIPTDADAMFCDNCEKAEFGHQFTLNRRRNRDYDEDEDPDYLSELENTFGYDIRYERYSNLCGCARCWKYRDFYAIRGDISLREGNHWDGDRIVFEEHENDPHIRITDPDDLSCGMCDLPRTHRYHITT